MNGIWPPQRATRSSGGLRLLSLRTAVAAAVLFCSQDRIRTCICETPTQRPSRTEPINPLRAASNQFRHLTI